MVIEIEPLHFSCLFSRDCSHQGQEFTISLVFIGKGFLSGTKILFNFTFGIFIYVIYKNKESQQAADVVYIICVREILSELVYSQHC